MRAILATLPANVRSWLRGVDVVADYDPAWIGLHYLRDASHGRSLASTSHVVYEHHLRHLPRDRRATTIVLMGGDAMNADTVIHEAGHVLDDRLNFDRPNMAALTSYAATNRWEAFAMAFRAWCNTSRDTDGWYHQNRDDLAAIDPAAVRFFDTLPEYITGA